MFEGLTQSTENRQGLTRGRTGSGRSEDETNAEGQVKDEGQWGRM